MMGYASRHKMFLAVNRNRLRVRTEVSVGAIYEFCRVVRDCRMISLHPLNSANLIFLLPNFNLGARKSELR